MTIVLASTSLGRGEKFFGLGSIAWTYLSGFRSLFHVRVNYFTVEVSLIYFVCRFGRR